MLLLYTVVLVLLSSTALGDTATQTTIAGAAAAQARAPTTTTTAAGAPLPANATLPANAPSSVLVLNAGAAQAPLTSLPQVRLDNIFAASQFAADLLRARFCTPARFTPPRQQPHVFFGPGVSIRVTTGSIAIDEKELLLNKAPAFNKTLPTVDILITPAELLSKTAGRAQVTTRFCRIQRNFGQQTTTVLRVFDGANNFTGSGMDRQAIINTVVLEVSKMQRADVVEDELFVGFLRANKLLLPFVTVLEERRGLAGGARAPSAPAPPPAARSPALPTTLLSTFERLAPSLAF